MTQDAPDIQLFRVFRLTAHTRGLPPYRSAPLYLFDKLKFVLLSHRCTTIVFETTNCNHTVIFIIDNERCISYFPTNRVFPACIGFSPYCR